MVDPVPVINTTKPATVAQRGRYWEVEIEVDSDAPAVFKNTQQVTTGTAASRALMDSADNARIDYFIVNHIDTAGSTVSHLYETQRVYLVYAKGRVSNEKGVDRHTTVYRFICRGNRSVGSTAISGSQANDEQYTGIQKITVNSSDCTNILWYEWEFVGQDGGDILTPRFTPNTYESVGVTEWPGKYWRLRFGIDSTSTVFDSYINDDGANAVIPDLSVTIVKSDGNTRVHTYQASKSYVSNFDPSSEVAERATYNTSVVEVVCIGTRTDT